MCVQGADASKDIAVTELGADCFGGAASRLRLFAGAGNRSRAGGKRAGRPVNGSLSAGGRRGDATEGDDKLAGGAAWGASDEGESE